MKRLDLQGKTYTKLLVLRKNEERSKKERISFFDCLCVCGLIKTVRGNKLVNGTTKSCGSCRAKGVPNPQKILAGTTERGIISSYKRRAKKLGLNFTLTFEDCVRFFKENCYYCDASPSNCRRPRNTIIDVEPYVYNGIDRVDNSKGYELKNCVPCCKDCNIAKSTRSKEEFIEWARKIITTWSDK